LIEQRPLTARDLREVQHSRRVCDRQEARGTTGTSRRGAEGGGEELREPGI
ncbi:hypothetical protein KI387_025818, partial [Taxus chinensis]